jgi:hypothetical protein
MRPWLTGLTLENRRCRRVFAEFALPRNKLHSMLIQKVCVAISL